MLRDRFGFGRRQAVANDEAAQDGVASNGGGTTRTGTVTTAPAAPAAAPGAPARTGRLVTPRTRGLLSGLIILVLGVWGGIVPFIGPYFHYSFINHHAWHWTTGRLWLDVIPGAVALIAGLELMRTGNRVSGVFAGWLAAAAGTWFVVGQTVSTLWNHGVSQAGRPLGGTFLRMIEQLGYFYALGAAILFLGALALGRFAVLAAREVPPGYARSGDLRSAETREPTVTRREPVTH